MVLQVPALLLRLWAAAKAILQMATCYFVPCAVVLQGLLHKGDQGGLIGNYLHGRHAAAAMHASMSI